MTDQAEVVDAVDRQRFELAIEGHVAFSAYKIHRSIITFTHTIVPSALRGKGVGSRLIAGALAQVRARGLKVRPDCEFVRAYIERHPEEQDLLAEPLA